MLCMKYGHGDEEFFKKCEVKLLVLMLHFISVNISSRLHYGMYL